MKNKEKKNRNAAANSVDSTGEYERKFRLRRSIPLKVMAHLSMFASFCCIMAAVAYGIFLFEMYYGTYSRSFAYSENNAYFNTTHFTTDYSDAMSRLVSFISVAENHNAFEDLEQLEYWRNAYMGSYVNFQYIFYDTSGQMLLKSDGFDLSTNQVDLDGNTANGRVFYYSVDLKGLNLYNIAEFTEEDRNYPAYNTLGSNFMHDEWYYWNQVSASDRIGYIYTYVPENLESGDTFSYHSETVASMDELLWPIVFGTMAVVMIFLICLIYTLVSAGWSNSYEGIRIYWFDKIFTEFGTAIILIFAGLMVAACIMFINFAVVGRETEEIVMAYLCMAASYIATMICVYSLARRVKVHNLLPQSLIYKLFHGIYRVIYQGMINNHLLRKYVSVVLGLGVLDLILMYAMVSADSVMFKLIVWLIYGCEFIYIGRKLVAIQDIAVGAKEIAGGHLDYKIDTKDMGSGVFLEFANNINNIGLGLNRAVDESIKSERMKADLITNVSHDIKTPLTSIINYVDLLKRQNITQEPVHEYIEILDSKSQRLKMLIEDLVEASRASSGNITLECTTIDFYELVQQIAGTYVEKYDQRQLSLVMRQPEESLLIYADGRRMYRVLDNLFNNAFKYAMSGSRIYLDLYGEGDDACFVMKNISQAPLNITAEELTQRFVRGDVSRTTEGSGLGLSIAESLVQLHGGQFKIYLDGDLFKATIHMPRVFPMPDPPTEPTPQ